MAFKRIERIKMHRTVAQQIIGVNKFNVNTLHITEPGMNEVYIRQEQNARKAISTMPAAFDFVANMLTLHKIYSRECEKQNITNERTQLLQNDNGNTHYTLNIDFDSVINYFLEENMLVNFRKQLTRINMQYVSLWRFHERKFYLKPMHPIIIKTPATNGFCMSIEIAKCVFRGMIENEYESGYITLPSGFMPRILQQEQAKEKADIIYRTNIFGLLANKEKKEEIKTKRSNFCKEVLSNYTRPKNGAGYYLDNDYFKLFQDSINPNIENIADVYEGEFSLVKKVTLGKSEDKRTGRAEEPTHLFFTHGGKNSRLKH